MDGARSVVIKPGDSPLSSFARPNPHLLFRTPSLYCEALGKIVLQYSSNMILRTFVSVPFCNDPRIVTFRQAVILHFLYGKVYSYTYSIFFIVYSLK